MQNNTSPISIMDGVRMSWVAVKDRVATLDAVWQGVVCGTGREGLQPHKECVSISEVLQCVKVLVDHALSVFGAKLAMRVTGHIIEKFIRCCGGRIDGVRVGM